MSDKEPIDIAADELLAMMNEKGDTPWGQFKKQLEYDLGVAQHRLEIAEQIEGICSATKPRKVRSDKGRKRKAAEAVTDPAEEPKE